MSVIFRDFGTSSSGTTPGDTPSPTDPNLVNISRFTPTEIEFSIIYQGLTYKLAFLGQFNSDQLGFMPLTLADLISTDIGSTVAISQVLLSQADNFLNSTSFTPAVTFDQWEAFDNQTLEGLTALLSGNDTYYNSSEASFDEGSNSYFLFDGNDTLFQNHPVLQYDDVFYGGGGIDKAVMPGLFSSYSIISRTDVWNQIEGVGNLLGYSISHNEDSVNTLQLHEVERLSFSDTNVALDLGRGEHAGQAARLYQTVYDRLPDEEGLGFWIYAFDNGANILDVAQNFMNSDEFPERYGVNPDNSTFLATMYTNVFGREYDQEGYDFWLAALDNGLARNSLLAQFSESPEFCDQMAPIIGQSIVYTEYLG